MKTTTTASALVATVFMAGVSSASLVVEPKIEKERVQENLKRFITLT